MNTQEFNRFIYLDNFRLAWRRVRNSSNLQVKDRLSLRVFESNLETHLWYLVEDIRRDNYNPTSALRIFEPKKSGGLRPFSLLSIFDRIVYQALGNIIIQNAYHDLMPLADVKIFAHLPQKPTSDFTLLSAKSHGRHKGQYEKFRRAIIKAQRSTSYDVVIKTDIASFYPSIDYSILLSHLKENSWLTDERLLNLLHLCLECWSPIEENLPLRRGIPIGYETSDMLSTLYLIDVDQTMIDYCHMIRYVDDMYLFADSEKHVKHAFMHLDYLLQAKGLALQTAKTEFEDFSNSDEDEEVKVETELQQRLSMIQDEVKSTGIDSDAVQLDLLHLFLDLWKSVNNGQELESYSSQYAYILWRLKIRDHVVRDAALYLLTNLPDRALFTTKYLSLFEHDDLVTETLAKIALDEYYHTHLRVNSLKALFSVDTTRAYEIAKLWCENEKSDWYMLLSAVEILQSYYPALPILKSISTNNNIPPVIAASLIAEFYLSDRRDEKTHIIKMAIENTNNYISLVGFYLWRRAENLNWNEINMPFLSPRLARLKSESTQEDVNLRQNLLSLFRIEISTFLRIEHSRELAHLLSDIQSGKETNPNYFIQALYAFCQILIKEWRNNEIVYDTLFPEDILGLLSLTYQQSIGGLILYHSRLPRLERDALVFSSITHTSVIKSSEIRRLLKAIALPIGLVFKFLHEEANISPPQSLLNLLVSEQQSFQFFISYKREDKKHAMAVYNFLQNLGYSVWIDFEKLNYNSWQDQINLALRKSKALILIATHLSIESEQVKKEWKYMINRKKDVLVFEIDQNIDYHYVIDDLNRIQVHQVGLEESLSKLLEWTQALQNV